VTPGVAPQRATPAGVRLTRLAIAIGVVIAMLYALGGSPVSAAAVGFVAAALLGVHLFVPQNVALSTVTNGFQGVIWTATLVVGLRTGGPQSPMVMWNFIPPITTYVLAGRRAAMLWGTLSAIQIGFLNAAPSLGVPFANDLTGNAGAIHRTMVFIVSMVIIGLVVTGNESYRSASQEAIDHANQTLERQRILGDMHDGVGSQLLGLMLQVRAKRIDDERLLQGLGSAIDDLKLIVDSLDPMPRSFELAVAEMRSRFEPRFDAAQVELRWSVVDPPSFGPESTLQILRALQEMTTNALRHAQASTVDVALQPSGSSDYAVSVRDDGVGFDPANPTRVGRGLTSLNSRAQRLGGTLNVESSGQGTTMTLRLPLPR
jgi:signal transduction histidine kinase